jgi:hypothetical protein
MPALGSQGSFSSAKIGAKSTPYAPTLGTSTPGNEQLSIAFTAPSFNGNLPITNYEYALSTDGVTYGAWVARSPSSTSSPLVLTGLTNGTQYYVKLRAVNAIGSGLESNVVSSNTTPRTVPSAPSITTITPGNTTLSVEFASSASTGGATISGYDYAISTNGGTTYGAWISTGLTSGGTFLISSLTNGTTYTIKMRANNIAGSSADSSSSSSTPRTTPGAPTISSITRGNQQLTLNWTTPSNGGSAITDYERSSDGTTWTSMSTTGNSFTVTSLAKNTTYSFYVRAVNAAGAGAASSVASARTYANPTAVTVTLNDSCDTTAFSWGSSNGDDLTVSYEYRLSTNGGSSYGSWVATSANQSVSYSTRNNTSSYRVQVKATTSVGEATGTSAASTAYALQNCNVTTPNGCSQGCGVCGIQYGTLTETRQRYYKPGFGCEGSCNVGGVLSSSCSNYGSCSDCQGAVGTAPCWTDVTASYYGNYGFTFAGKSLTYYNIGYGEWIIETSGNEGCADCTVYNYILYTCGGAQAYIQQCGGGYLGCYG